MRITITIDDDDGNSSTWQPSGIEPPYIKGPSLILTQEDGSKTEIDDRRAEGGGGGEEGLEDRLTRARWATSAAWVRLETPSLARIRETWRLAVFGLMKSRSAIWRLVMPSPTSASTSSLARGQPVLGER